MRIQTKLLQTSPISFDDDYYLTEDILAEHENRFKRIDNPAWLTIFTPDHSPQESIASSTATSGAKKFVRVVETLS